MTRLLLDSIEPKQNFSLVLIVDVFCWQAIVDCWCFLLAREVWLGALNLSCGATEQQGGDQKTAKTFFENK